MRTDGALNVSGMVTGPGWPAATGPRLGTAIQPGGDESKEALASANNQPDSIASANEKPEDPRVVVVGGGQTGG